MLDESNKRLESKDQKVGILNFLPTSVTKFRLKKERLKTEDLGLNIACRTVFGF